MVLNERSSAVHVLSIVRELHHALSATDAIEDDQIPLFAAAFRANCRFQAMLLFIFCGFFIFGRF